MVYGVERNEPATREKWERLLLQYSKLDSLSMHMVPQIQCRRDRRLRSALFRASLNSW